MVFFYLWLRPFGESLGVLSIQRPVKIALWWLQCIYYYCKLILLLSMFLKYNDKGALSYGIHYRRLTIIQGK